MEHTQQKYYSQREKDKGIKKMQKKGWTVMQVSTEKERPCACCLLGLISFLLPKVTVWVVDYRR